MITVRKKVQIGGTVRKEDRNCDEPAVPGTLPRVTRLMALAIRFDESAAVGDGSRPGPPGGDWQSQPATDLANPQPRSSGSRHPGSTAVSSPAHAWQALYQRKKLSGQSWRSSTGMSSGKPGNHLGSVTYRIIVELPVVAVAGNFLASPDLTCPRTRVQ